MRLASRRRADLADAEDAVGLAGLQADAGVHYSQQVGMHTAPQPRRVICTSQPGTHSISQQAKLATPLQAEGAAAV